MKIRHPNIFVYDFAESIFIDPLGEVGYDSNGNNATLVILFSNPQFIVQLLRGKINVISYGMKSRVDGTAYPEIKFELTDKCDFFDEDIPDEVQIDIVMEALETSIMSVEYFEEAVYLTFGKKIQHLNHIAISTMFVLFVVFLLGHQPNDDSNEFVEIDIQDIVNYFKEIKSKIIGGF